MSDSSKYSHINFVPPASVAKAAERGLKLRDKFNRGGTAVGIARGRDLANRKALSPSTVKRMRSFFARHAGDKKPGWSKPSDPTNGYIAWMLWGGNPGKSWADKVVRQMESADKKAKKKPKKTTKKKASAHVRLASVQRRLEILARLQTTLAVLAKKKKWIQDAIKHPGRLHKHFDIPEGETIPMSKINAEIKRLKGKESRTKSESSLLRALNLAKSLKS